MAKSLTISGTEKAGSNAKVRAAGQVPAVLYGHGVDNQSLSISARDLTRVFREAGHTSLVTLTIANQDYNVLIREIQHHPVKNQALHVDFYQVNLKEKVRADVPLILTGESSAVKDMGGVLLQNLDTVEVEALPTDLPHDIQVDISVISDFDTVIDVSKLTLPEGVDILTDSDTVIALVQAPRTEAELESLSEEVTEDVEGVEGVKKEEAEEGEDGEAKAEDEDDQSDTQTGE